MLDERISDEDLVAALVRLRRILADRMHMREDTSIYYADILGLAINRINAGKPWPRVYDHDDV